MQTPRAGLRTHADVAVRASDGPTRERALERIRQSVDRTARLVRQLLDWSRHDVDRAPSGGPAMLGSAAQIVREELAHLSEPPRVTLEINDAARAERRSVGQGTIVYVSDELGGRRMSKKKNQFAKIE